MKHLLIFLLVLATSQECSQLEQDTKVIRSVTYNAMTRGSSFKCIINEKKITVISKGSDLKNGEREISKQQWEDLGRVINRIQLENIGKLNAPSKESSIDAALIASVVITIDDKVFESNTFDHGNPPKELKPLTNKILALAETVE